MDSLVKEIRPQPIVQDRNAALPGDPSTYGGGDGHGDAGGDGLNIPE